jgi:S1-C subfamily serine protease
VNICHDCDLAIITPEEPDFLDGITPLRIGSLPSLRDRVLVCGFPIGGEELSITEGVVSRVEIQPYSHSKRLMLAAQVDAAINSGNSGGPVLSKDGTLVGIAFQALEGAENMGYMVPPPIIKHFLEGTKRDGIEYKGFPDLGILVQPLPNPMMRQFLQMKKEQSGVLVTKVFCRNSAWNVLKEKDVILEIDGYPVANNGTVRFFNEYRTDANVIVHQHFVGEQLSLKVLRDGKELTLTLTLLPSVELVPLSQFDVMPTYYIYCGLVFQPLSLDYIHATFGFNFHSKAPIEMIEKLYHGKKYLDKIREVIVLTMVLVDHLNVGYDEVAGEIITHVNEQPITDLVDLVEKIESVTKPTDEEEPQSEVKEEIATHNYQKDKAEKEEEKTTPLVATEKDTLDFNSIKDNTCQTGNQQNQYVSPSFALYWNFQKPLPKRLIKLTTSKNFTIILPPPYREEAKKAQEKMMLRYKVKKDRQLVPNLKIHDAL